MCSQILASAPRKATARPFKPHFGRVHDLLLFRCSKSHGQFGRLFRTFVLIRVPVSRFERRARRVIVFPRRPMDGCLYGNDSDRH